MRIMLQGNEQHKVLWYANFAKKYRPTRAANESSERNVNDLYYLRFFKKHECDNSIDGDAEFFNEHGEDFPQPNDRNP